MLVCHKVLDVQRNSSSQDIKMAPGKLVQMWHSAKNSENREETGKILVVEADEVLSDHKK